MELLTFLPINDGLKKIVESIIIVDIESSRPLINTEYHYPWTAKVSIFFTLSNEPLLIKEMDHYRSLPLCYTVGPRLANDIINIGKKRRQVVGITFKAGAFYRLMGIPVNLLTRENMETHYFFGKETREVEQKLKEAVNNNEILHIIEKFLLKRMRTIPPFSLFDMALEQSVKNKGNIKIQNLASTAGMSIRQFERKCEESLGLSPKLFARLTRFAFAYSLKENNPEMNWLSIALESGYFDQMHLIRDFKIFFGYNPSMISQTGTDRRKILSVLEEKHGLLVGKNHISMIYCLPFCYTIFLLKELYF